MSSNPPQALAVNTDYLPQELLIENVGGFNSVQPKILAFKSVGKAKGPILHQVNYDTMVIEIFTLTLNVRSRIRSLQGVAVLLRGSKKSRAPLDPDIMMPPGEW
jgi:hypothetical protein